MATDGKWTCSTDEEHWNCGEEFDTEAEALGYAMHTLAYENGIGDGASVWAGQISAITIDQLVEGTIDQDSILDQMACWISDNVGPDFVDDIDWSKEQGKDLEARLLVTFREWATAHSIAPRCFTLESVKRHVWEQCKEMAGAEQCVHHIEHDGEHEDAMGAHPPAKDSEVGE